jgi:hypothetical protein
MSGDVDLPQRFEKQRFTFLPDHGVDTHDLLLEIRSDLVTIA